jgi:hypothetical protein
MRTKILCVALFIGFAGALLNAQDAFPRIVGPEDQQIPMPTGGVQGRKDPGAMQELISFLKTTQLASFIDMRGIGTALLPGGDSSPLPATMHLQGADKFRLDIQTSSGTRTIVFNGALAIVQHEDKTSYALPPTAGTNGVAVFPRPALTDFSGTGFSLIDHGLILVKGIQLHRITVQSAFSRRSSDNTGHDVDLATDLYFDATSHLLVKSATAIRLNEGGPQPYLQVVSYEDYRRVNGILVPFGYRKTLNGQLEWAMQLNDAQINAGVDSSMFQAGR